jgi:hypothetical protein
VKAVRGPLDGAARPSTSVLLPRPGSSTAIAENAAGPKGDRDAVEAVGHVARSGVASDALLLDAARRSSPSSNLLGGDPASHFSSPPGSHVIITPGAETVSSLTLLSLVAAEVPFSRGVGCYTPPTSPSRTSSPSSTPPVVPSAPPSKRGTRHAVAEDGSIATDEDTMQKAMCCKATINIDYSGIASKTSSFVSLSTPILSSKLNAISIKLGKNSSEINVSANVFEAYGV